MKTKLNKWHIFLMSFITLFITVCASLFSLKADTIDDETGEMLTDNWEIGLVFYDSAINNGNTPLTEINWDASDGSYKLGESRVITVQINYKNTSTTTTYNPGDVTFSIPNLAYYVKNNLKINSITVDGNTPSVSGLTWTFLDGKTKPSDTVKQYTFTNAKTFNTEENFQGSLQITYSLQSPQDKLEFNLDSCLHENNVDLHAMLILNNVDNSHTITSTNWPSYYPNNMNEDTHYWEYTSNSYPHLGIFIDSSSRTATEDDYIRIYDSNNEMIAELSKSSFGGNIYTIRDNYVKFTMTTNSTRVEKGFSATIKPVVASNKVSFNYTRTYVHPWMNKPYVLTKSAEKVSSWDRFSIDSNDYYIIKYRFNIVARPVESGYLGKQCFKMQITDQFPEDCLLFDYSKNPIELDESNIYTMDISPSSSSTDEYGVKSYSYSDKYVYVAYPKSKYENQTITNTAQLYGQYEGTAEYVYLSEDDVEFLINDFRFEYPPGNLYGFVKKGNSNKLLYQSIVSEGNSTKWLLTPTIKYTGQPYTLQIGDDLLYIKDSQGNITKLTDNEYFFERIEIPFLSIKNADGLNIKGYQAEIYVRYAGETSYQLHSSFTLRSTWHEFLFTEEDKVVGFYVQINDINESIIPVYTYDKVVETTVNFKKEDITNTGTLYNFSYLKIYTKDENGNLILQNEPTFDSYANLLTQNEIATYDQENYGSYLQRSLSSCYWSYYTISQSKLDFAVAKSASSTIQREEDEIFTGSFTVQAQLRDNTDPYITSSNIYWQQLTDESFHTNLKLIDYLPAGIELTSTPEEIIESLHISSVDNNTYFVISSLYNRDGNQAFETKEELVEFLKEKTSITITENANNLNRTKIEIEINLEDYPLTYIERYFNSQAFSPKCLPFSYTFNYQITYDSVYEYGKTYVNIVSGTSTDNITGNGFKSASATATINKVISTHEPVQKQVKTNMHNYKTGKANSDYGAEYGYKLRASAIESDLTNLIFIDNIEQSFGKNEYWQGQFLGVDTSFAENKTYKVYDPTNPNADSSGYITENILVKTYYSENPTENQFYLTEFKPVTDNNGNYVYDSSGNLLQQEVYALDSNGNRIKNPNWKEYINDTLPELYQNGLEVKFNSQCNTENVAYDYVDIFYVLDGTTYKLGRWGGTDLANKTIQIPSTDFYLYWRTDGGGSSFYGFSIDSISPIYIEDVTSTAEALPNYTAEEISGDVYPDSAFGSYVHGNYGNRVNKLWHYTYTGELEKVQEFVQETDKTKVKSIAFEILNAETLQPAIIPQDNFIYVEILMRAPSDENIKTLAYNSFHTQWNALDEFGQYVDFINGINSNIVKISLPNSVEEDSSYTISLRFTKEIQGTETQFENMKLKKVNPQTFMIRLTSLTENDDGGYNQITALLRSNQELIISKIPIGTYLLEELDDNYFDFVDFVENNDSEIIVEGITFERTNQGYIITVSEDLTENIEFNIKVTNETEPFRPYEDKDNKENLFLKNKIEEDPENPS